MYSHLSYSHYLMAMLIGKLLLKANHLSLAQLTHKNFNDIKNYFNSNKDSLFEKANQIILNVLKQQYGDEYATVALRKLAAAFRKNETIPESLSKI